MVHRRLRAVSSLLRNFTGLGASGVTVSKVIEYLKSIPNDLQVVATKLNVYRELDSLGWILSDGRFGDKTIRSQPLTVVWTAQDSL